MTGSHCANEAGEPVLPQHCKAAPVPSSCKLLEQYGSLLTAKDRNSMREQQNLAGFMEAILRKQDLPSAGLAELERETKLSDSHRTRLASSSSCQQMG